MNLQPDKIWIAADILLGFQVTSFAARIKREIAVGQQRDINWLPPSDILNLLSIVVLTVGVFILPVFGFGDQPFMTYSFGLAMILFMDYSFGFAGHYAMYNNRSNLSYRYFLFKEKVVITVIDVLSITYVLIVTIKSIMMITLTIHTMEMILFHFNRPKTGMSSPLLVSLNLISISIGAAHSLILIRW